MTTSSPLQPVLRCLALLLCLVYLESSQVLAQEGDGGAAGGLQPGSLGSDSDGSQTAASEGPDTGSANLSHGAVIAIAVVVSLTVVLGVTTAVLFFLAKKRQWKIKEGLRRSARRVTSAVKAVTTPLTPKKMTFSPIEKKMHNAETAEKLKRANSQHKFETSSAAKKKTDRQSSKARDLEKGLPDSAVKVEEPATDVVDAASTNTSPKKDSKSRPRLPNVKIPSSAFEMDSPKTPMWKKVFGR